MTYHLIIDYAIGIWGYSKQYVRNELAKLGNKPINVKISSLGGDLDHALDIRQQFIDHGNVTVYLSAFNASAATVIAMGAKRVVMSKYGAFMVHKCSNFIDAWGSYNADQMQQLIDELTENKKENDMIDVVLANLYAARCKKNVSEILAILKKGAWLSPEEALDLGFVDELSDSIDDKPVKVDMALSTKFNALGLSTEGLKLETDEPDGSVMSKAGKALKSLFSKTVDKEISVQLPNHASMKKYNFKSVEKLLKMDEITPDADGHVSVTAEEFESISGKLGSLESDLKTQTDAVAEKQAKIDELTAQIKALQDAPGDETSDVKDDGADGTVTFNDMFNSVKDAI